MCLSVFITFLGSYICNVEFVKLKINAERKSKVDDNTARMQSIKQLGV